jgi:hypothetical protein
MRRMLARWPKLVALIVILGVMTVPLLAQAIMKLTDGTYAQKVVVYTLSGAAEGAILESIDTQIGDLISRMGADVQDDAVAPATMTGPLQMGYAKATAPTAVGSGDTVKAWRSLKGEAFSTISVDGAIVGGDATNGLDVDVTRVTGTVTVADSAATSGGTTPCYITSAASTNSTSCKGSAGQLYGVEVVNTTSTLYYLRLYNSSSAPTCSSATGFVRTIPVPHATGAGGGLANFYSVGEVYGTGVGFCLTGGGSSTDNTNAATGVYVTLFYK